MAATTPRRSSRFLHNHTPKMSERKKGLFPASSEPQKESLTAHRHLPVVDSESDSEDCDLGIIATLDSSSDEHSTPATPERIQWHGTRSQTQRLRENYDLKSFIKSPFTLKKYQTRYSCPETRCGSSSTPATPHLQHYPGTPSSTHSCASAHTTSSHSSRARKSLASLIADTESCSSSLKDLNFDTDSGTDSKENTPTKSVRSSNRKTPKNTFKGVLVEQKKNSPFQNGLSPMRNAVVCLTKIDMTGFISPSQILKTPNTTEVVDSPPKLAHNRRAVVEIGESPESNCDSEKSYKRLRNDSLTDTGPISKHPRLENAPKARLSLFNSDRLKEILSAKSFYGKNNPELNTNITAKIANAIEVTTTKHKSFTHSHSSRRKRKPGQINMGVRHKIRKPKHKKMVLKYNTNKGHSGLNNSTLNSSKLNNSTVSNMSVNDSSILSQNSSQDLANDKADPFDKEKQTIEDILSQWEEEEIPDTELRSKPELPCFSNTIIEETKQIFQPITAIPVDITATVPQDDAVIVELGARNGINMTVTDSSATITLMNKIVPQTGTTITEAGGMTATQTGMDVSQNVTASQGDVTVTQPGMTITQADMTITQTCMTITQPSMTITQPGMTITQPGITIAQSDMPKERVLIGSNENDVVMSEPSHADVHGVPKTGQFLPVEGGYIVVEENGCAVQEDLPDLDEIERELRMLDEQILKMAESNNINAKAVLASTETDLPVVVNESTSASPDNKTKTEKATKLFPIFSNPNPGVTTPKSKGEKQKPILKTGLDQYVIDAGQKKFGATQCSECGTIYQIGDPQDEHDHLVHHNATDVLRFNGWKEECIIEKGENWRIIRVRGGDPNWRRIETLLQRVVHPQLGYEGALANRNVHSMTAYLYIEKKQIVGCVIAETKTKAYKLIPGESDCCSVEHYPVKCGISRLWTHINRRRRGISRRLVDCARASFLYGTALRTCDVAFSTPTASGKAFATKYCGLQASTLQI